MNADTERISGRYGTVEQQYKPKAGERYSHATKPKPLGPIAIHGTRLTTAQRSKLKRIDEQHSKRVTPRRNYKTSAVWAQYEGYRTYDDTYGITVKIRGVPEQIYWNSWTQSSVLWYEITGLNLQELA